MFRQMGATVERSCWAISASEAPWPYWHGLHEVGVPDVFQAPSVIWKFISRSVVPKQFGTSARLRFYWGRVAANP